MSQSVAKDENDFKRLHNRNFQKSERERERKPFMSSGRFNHYPFFKSSISWPPTLRKEPMECSLSSRLKICPDFSAKVHMNQFLFIILKAKAPWKELEIWISSAMSGAITTRKKIIKLLFRCTCTCWLATMKVFSSIGCSLGC